MPSNKVLERMRNANFRAELQLHRFLNGLERSEKGTMDSINKETIQLRHELQVNAFRRIKYAIERELDSALHKEKEDIEADVQTHPEQITRQKTWTSYISDDDDFSDAGSEDSFQIFNPPKNFQRPAYLGWMGKEGKLPSPNNTNFRRADTTMSEAVIPERGSKLRIRTAPPGCREKSTNGAVDPKEFNQFTDGTMLLAMRRFEYRKREIMPQLVGHLPVRKRSNKEFSRPKTSDIPSHYKKIMEELKNTLKEMKKKRMQTTVVSCNNKFYIPKQKPGDQLQVNQEEYNRIMHLRKADEKEQYADVLKRIGSFVGADDSKYPIQKVELNREDTFLLERLRPTFRTPRVFPKSAIQDQHFMVRRKTVAGL